MLRFSRMRALRTAGSVEPLSPNSRSNTARGLFSIGSGMVGVRHEIVWVYAQLRPEVHCPALASLSMDSSSEASGVEAPNSRASIWSIDVSATTSVSDVPPRLVPVRNEPEAPAWT